MKLSFIVLIRSAFVGKDEKFRQKLSVFLVCLVIAIIIWFTLKLSDDYDTVIQVPITFTNIPKNKVLTNVSDTLLEVEILEKGSDIFRLLYIDPFTPVPISLRYLPVYPKGGTYRGILNTSLLINEIERQHGLLGKVISITPDSIYLTFEPEKSVKVPVKASFDLSFEKEYKKYGQAVFSPDSVTVKGPERLIEQLDSANLGTIRIEKLNETYSGESIFQRDSLNKGLTFSPDNVIYTIPVEKFTEAEAEVHVVIINSNGMQAKTFPDKVKVFYTVALKDFAKVEPAMIQAVADLSAANLAQDGRVKVSIKNHPPFIRITKIQPEKVEFIIIK